MEIQPHYSEAHNNLGMALTSRWQTEEAIAHYRKALEIKPDYAEARKNLNKRSMKEKKRARRKLASNWVGLKLRLANRRRLSQNLTFDKLGGRIL